MTFEKEARQLYNIAHSVASKEQRKINKKNENGHPIALSTILDNEKISEVVNVGIMDIPTDKIVGVVSSDGTEDIYTPDFLPLLAANTEYAEKWRRLYLDYLTDEGIRDPIGCYEYLGNFYVTDGMKRVSVLKSYGAATISAQVFRVMPVESNTPKIKCYKEFLKHFRLTGLYQVSFNQPENFKKLQVALGYDPNHAWTDMDRYSFMFNWYGFDRAYKKVFGEDKNLTAADMLVKVLEDYSYNEVRRMDPWDREKVLLDYRNKFYGAGELSTEVEFFKVS